MNSNRKYSLWESRFLTKNLELSMTIVDSLSKESDNLGISLAKMPNSELSTEDLFNIASCNIMMYDRVLDEELIKSGNKKASTTTH